MTPSLNFAARGVLCVILLGGRSLALAQWDQPVDRHISLRECIQTALLQNHALQIQRLNPEIARSTLTSSRGLYDPMFAADVRRESLSDSGGFDPADFSRDAVYAAESLVAKLGLTGVLPSGLQYFAGGNYANSFGTRNALDFDSYNLFTGVTIRQPLLKNFWIDQGRMTLQVNQANLKITELGVTFLTMDIINQVQQAYYELLAARDLHRIQLRLLGMREKFLAGVQRQIDVGKLIPPDAHLAQSQHAVAQADAVTASNQVTLAENALRLLLGEAFTNAAHARLVPGEPLLVMPETLDLSDSWSRGLRRRPDLAQLRQDLLRTDIDLKYRRNQLFPSLELVAGYGRRGASTFQTLPGQPASASSTEAFSQIERGENPNDLIGLIFALPLGRTTERANYRAGKQLKAQAELLIKQREEQVMREISDALNTSKAGWDRMQATRRAVRFSEDALAAEERKLAGGKSTLFFVLQLQRDLTTAQAADVRAKTDYTQALSQLHFAEASLLEANQITVEYR